MNPLYLNLCKVKALILAGWGQGRGRDETHLCPLDALFCMAQTCQLKDVEALRNALYDELQRTTGEPYQGFVDWNDHPSRTKQEVLDLIQRAADRAAGAPHA